MLLRIDLKTLFKNAKRLLAHDFFFYQKLVAIGNNLSMLLFNNLCFMTSCRPLSLKKFTLSHC